MTITSIRPINDSYKQGVSFSTGAAIWSLIDDGVTDDATYIFNANGVQYPTSFFHLNMAQTISLSASQRILRCRIRARIRINTASSNASATAKLAFRNPYDGTFDFLESFSSWQTSVAERSGVWRNSPPKDKAGKRWGTEWTAAGVNVMHVTGQLFYAWNTQFGIRITELWNDVDIRDQPTVTALPVVTGFTSSTYPTLTWVYVPNADNDPQTRYRVKIFTAAQYGASGFSPSTSAASWDSGELTGTANSLQSGQGLLNGVTYKMYVAAAQDFNGAAWYSAWTPSAAFTVALTPPPVPTLTVTPDTTIPALRNALRVSANGNLLTLDDSSGDPTIGTWVNDVNTTLAQSATFAEYGADSLRMTAASAATMSIRTASGTGGYLVKAGVTYQFLASFRSAATVRTVKVGAAFYNRAGTIIGAVAYGSGLSDAVGSWTQVTYSVAAPTGAVFCAVFAQVTSPANAEIHYLDQIAMTTGTASAVWSPGGQYGVMSTVVQRSWATAGQRNLAHPQLQTGGVYEGSTNGFFVTGAASAVAVDTLEAHRGGSSIRWDVNDAAGKLYIGWMGAADDNPSPEYPLAGVPGTGYTLACWLKADAAFSATITLQAIDHQGNTVGAPVTSGALSLTTAWQLATLAFTVPAGSVWVRPQLNNSASVTERSVYVDDIQWVIGSTVDTPGGFGTGLGTEWEPVVGADEGELLLGTSPGAQTATVYDEAVPPGYTVTYRAWNLVPAVGTTPPLSSASTLYVQTLMASPGKGVWVLKDPFLLSRAMQIHVIAMGAERQDEELEVFHPLRPEDTEGGMRAVVVSDWLGGYDGELTLMTDSEAEWLNLREILSVRGVLWLVFPDFGGRFIRITDRSWDRTTPRTGVGADSVWRRTLKVPFVHTGRLG